jgi:hypothetical protein
MPQDLRLWQGWSMKNGSPEELDFSYDDDFAVFAFGSSKRKHLRRKCLRQRKRVRNNQRGKHGK